MIEQAVGLLQKLLVPPREIRNHRVVHAAHPFGCQVEARVFIQGLSVLGHGRTRVVQAGTELGGPAPQRVRMLRKLPQVPAKQNLDLELGRERRPARQRFHQKDRHVPKRGDDVGLLRN